MRPHHGPPKGFVRRSQQMSSALSGKVSVDEALKANQTAADREMRKGGYYK